LRTILNIGAITGQTTHIPVDPIHNTNSYTVIGWTAKHNIEYLLIEDNVIPVTVGSIVWKGVTVIADTITIGIGVLFRIVRESINVVGNAITIGIGGRGLIAIGPCASGASAATATTTALKNN
jgi:hypothetical protein